MIKMLFKRVREYKTASILCPIVMVGEAVMEIIIPFLMTFIVGELEDLAKGKIDTVNGGKIALFASWVQDLRRRQVADLHIISERICTIIFSRFLLPI